MANGLMIKNNVMVCPVCGSSALAAEVICTALQDNNGNWILDKTDDEDLQFAVCHPNSQIRCTNEYCGPAHSPLYNDPIELGNKTMFQWWVDNIASEMDYVPQGGEEDEKFQEFLGSIFYIPWEGTIYEAKVLE